MNMIRRRKFNGKFIEFPLCCLIYAGGSKDRLTDIADYFIFDCAYRLKNTIDLEERINEVESTFNYSLSNKETAIKKYMVITGLINKHKKMHGTEPYCRIGKELFFETLYGKFEYEAFAVLCAVSAILGKVQAYKMITRERIGYAMIGYKSQDVYIKDKKGKLSPSSDKVIGRITDQLESKKLINKFTYNRRNTYYSTRVKTKKKLAEFVMALKEKKQARKLKTEDAELSKMINEKLNEQKIKHYKIVKLKGRNDAIGRAYT